MADLKALQASVADLTARVNADISVEASVVTLLAGIVQQNKDLAAQIAGMSADTTSQSDIDALAKQVSDTATSLDQATAPLAAAVAANQAPTPPAPSAAPSDGSKPQPLSGTGQPAQVPTDPAPAPAQLGDTFAPAPQSTPTP